MDNFLAASGFSRLVPKFGALMIVLSLVGCGGQKPQSSPATHSQSVESVYGFWYRTKKAPNPDAALRLVTEDRVLEVFSKSELSRARYEALRTAGGDPIFWMNVPQGQRWVLVELWGTSFERLRGEIDRWGPFALVELPMAESAHVWLGRHDLHVRELLTYETTLEHEIGSPIVDEKLVGSLSRPKGQADGFKSPFVDADTLDVAEQIVFLKRKLAEFSGEVPFGQGQTIKERGSDEGRRLAREWIRREFVGLGYEVREHTYRGRFSEGVNVIADGPTRPKGSEKVIVISSHYDSVGNAGADDNGAGVVGMLALAQQIESENLPFAVRFVFFDQEEKGLIGSKAYVDMLKSSGALDEVLGNINFEMLGYDSDGDGAIHIIDCNENSSPSLSQALVAILNERAEIPLKREAACTNRSDHASFWRYGKPAIVISQNFFGGDGNPCYHKSCDRLDRVNFSYMSQAIGLVRLGLSRVDASKLP